MDTLPTEVRARAEKHVPYLTTVIPLAKGAREAMLRVQRRLRLLDDQQFWHTPSYFHITLKSLGWPNEDVRTDNLPEILHLIGAVARHHRPFRLTLSGLGTFPDVVYVKIDRGAEVIRKLNVSLARELGNRVVHGLYEGARMVPHATIATLTRKPTPELASSITSMDRQDVGTMTVTRFLVVEAFFERIFGTKEEQRSAFEKVRTFRLGV